MATHSRILAWRVSMDRGAWEATVYAVTKSQTQLERCSRQEQAGLTIKKWGADPDPRSKVIIASNLHLFSTANGIFFPGPSSEEPRYHMPCTNVALLEALRKMQTEGGRNSGCRPSAPFLTSLFPL